MDFTTIEVGTDGTDGAVGHITLNRPDKLNPLSTTTLLELVGAAAHFDARPDVKVVVVGGHGRAFSAGADLERVQRREHRRREAARGGRRRAPDGRGHRIDARRDRCPHPRSLRRRRRRARRRVRPSSRDHRPTRFSIPEVALGIPLAWGGIPRLTREIGPAMTKELVMTCRPFDAEEARTLGFVNRVVDDDQLDAAVDELVGQLVDKSPLTLHATKQATNAAAQEMVSTANAWSDADALVTALHDRASREVATRLPHPPVRAA